MSNLSTDTKYTETKAQIIAEIGLAGKNVIGHYHAVGNIVSNYVKTAEKKYGSKLIQLMSEDLSNDPRLAGIQDVSRFLYWSKSFYERFQDLDAVMEMASKGFTISHAKVLLSADLDQSYALVNKMFNEDGKIVPVAKLQLIAKEEKINQIQEKIVEVVNSTTDATPEEQLAKQGVEQPVSKPVSSTTPEQAKSEPSNKVPKEPTKPKSEDTATSSKSPIASIKEYNKHAEKALDSIGSVIIAIGTVNKNDSMGEKAYKNWQEQLRFANQLTISLLESLDALHKKLQPDDDA